MDNRSRSENKYFFPLSIKKEQTELCVFFVPTLSEALRKYGRDSLLFYLFFKRACSPQGLKTPDENPVER